MLMVDMCAKGADTIGCKELIKGITFAEEGAVGLEKVSHVFFLQR